MFSSLSHRDRRIAEDLILEIGDEYDLKIEEEPGFFNFLLGNSGATTKSFRNAWSSIRDSLRDLVIWVYDFLRNLDANDLDNAVRIVRASEGSKRELLGAILKFAADKLRAYAWLGITLNPLSWGWITKSQGFSPKMMVRDAAAQHLLRMISCGYKRGCGNAYSCRKAGMKCSSVCRHCSGVPCNNVPDVPVEVDFNSTESDDLPNVNMDDVLWAQSIEDTLPSPDRDMLSRYDDPDSDEAEPGPSKRAKLT